MNFVHVSAQNDTRKQNTVLHKQKDQLIFYSEGESNVEQVFHSELKHH